MMNRFRKPFFVFSCATLLCVSFVPTQEKRYVDHIINRYSADLFHDEGLTLVKSQVKYGMENLSSINLSYTYYKPMNKADARALIMRLTKRLLDVINDDALLKKRNLFRGGHFCVDDLRIEVNCDCYISRAADCVEGIKTITLSKGIITYRTFTMSPYFTTYAHSTQEQYRDNIFLGPNEPSASQIIGENLESALERAQIKPELPFETIQLDLDLPEKNQTMQLETYNAMTPPLPTKPAKLDIENISKIPTNVAPAVHPVWHDRFPAVEQQGQQIHNNQQSTENRLQVPPAHVNRAVTTGVLSTGPTGVSEEMAPGVAGTEKRTYAMTALGESLQTTATGVASGPDQSDKTFIQPSSQQPLSDEGQLNAVPLTEDTEGDTGVMNESQEIVADVSLSGEEEKPSFFDRLKHFLSRKSKNVSESEVADTENDRRDESEAELRGVPSSLADQEKGTIEGNEESIPESIAMNEQQHDEAPKKTSFFERIKGLFARKANDLDPSKADGQVAEGQALDDEGHGDGETFAQTRGEPNDEAGYSVDDQSRETIPESASGAVSGDAATAKPSLLDRLKGLFGKKTASKSVDGVSCEENCDQDLSYGNEGERIQNAQRGEENRTVAIGASQDPCDETVDAGITGESDGHEAKGSEEELGLKETFFDKLRHVFTKNSSQNYEADPDSVPEAVADVANELDAPSQENQSNRQIRGDDELPENNDQKKEAVTGEVAEREQETFFGKIKSFFTTSKEAAHESPTDDEQAENNNSGQQDHSTLRVAEESGSPLVAEDDTLDDTQENSILERIRGLFTKIKVERPDDDGSDGKEALLGKGSSEGEDSGSDNEHEGTDKPKVPYVTALSSAYKDAVFEEEEEKPSFWSQWFGGGKKERVFSGEDAENNPHAASQTLADESLESSSIKMIASQKNEAVERDAVHASGSSKETSFLARIFGEDLVDQNQPDHNQLEQNRHENSDAVAAVDVDNETHELSYENSEHLNKDNRGSEEGRFSFFARLFGKKEQVAKEEPCAEKEASREQEIAEPEIAKPEIAEQEAPEEQQEPVALIQEAAQENVSEQPKSTGTKSSFFARLFSKNDAEQSVVQSEEDQTEGGQTESESNQEDGTSQEQPRTLAEESPEEDASEKPKSTGTKSSFFARLFGKNDAEQSVAQSEEDQTEGGQTESESNQEDETSQEQPRTLAGESSEEDASEKPKSTGTKSSFFARLFSKKDTAASDELQEASHFDEEEALNRETASEEHEDEPKSSFFDRLFGKRNRDASQETVKEASNDEIADATASQESDSPAVIESLASIQEEGSTAEESSSSSAESRPKKGSLFERFFSRKETAAQQEPNGESSEELSSERVIGTSEEETTQKDPEEIAIEAVIAFGETFGEEDSSEKGSHINDLPIEPKQQDDAPSFFERLFGSRKTAPEDLAEVYLGAIVPEALEDTDHVGAGKPKEAPQDQEEDIIIDPGFSRDLCEEVVPNTNLQNTNVQREEAPDNEITKTSTSQILESQKQQLASFEKEDVADSEDAQEGGETEIPRDQEKVAKNAAENDERVINDADQEDQIAAVGDQQDDSDIELARGGGGGGFHGEAGGVRGGEAHREDGYRGGPYHHPYGYPNEGYYGAPIYGPPVEEYYYPEQDIEEEPDSTQDDGDSDEEYPDGYYPEGVYEYGGPGYYQGDRHVPYEGQGPRGAGRRLLSDAVLDDSSASDNALLENDLDREKQPQESKDNKDYVESQTKAISEAATQNNEPSLPFERKSDASYLGVADSTGGNGGSEDFHEELARGDYRGGAGQPREGEQMQNRGEERRPYRSEPYNHPNEYQNEGSYGTPVYETPVEPYPYPVNTNPDNTGSGNSDGDNQSQSNQNTNSGQQYPEGYYPGGVYESGSQGNDEGDRRFPGEGVRPDAPGRRLLSEAEGLQKKNQEETEEEGEDGKQQTLQASEHEEAMDRQQPVAEADDQEEGVQVEDMLDAPHESSATDAPEIELARGGGAAGDGGAGGGFGGGGRAGAPESPSSEYGSSRSYDQMDERDQEREQQLYHNNPQDDYYNNIEYGYPVDEGYGDGGQSGGTDQQNSQYPGQDQGQYPEQNQQPPQDDNQGQDATENPADYFNNQRFGYPSVSSPYNDDGSANQEGGQADDSDNNPADYFSHERFGYPAGSDSNGSQENEYQENGQNPYLENSLSSHEEIRDEEIASVDDEEVASDEVKLDEKEASSTDQNKDNEHRIAEDMTDHDQDNEGQINVDQNSDQQNDEESPAFRADKKSEPVAQDDIFSAPSDNSGEEQESVPEEDTQPSDSHMVMVQHVDESVKAPSHDAITLKHLYEAMLETDADHSGEDEHDEEHHEAEPWRFTQLTPQSGQESQHTANADETTGEQDNDKSEDGTVQKTLWSGLFGTSLDDESNNEELKNRSFTADSSQKPAINSEAEDDKEEIADDDTSDSSEDDQDDELRDVNG